MATNKYWRALAFGTTALCAIPAVSMAQTAPAQTPPAEQATQVDEVIVTARRREERLQDVPLAVTAISTESLERANITSVEGLATQSPALTIVPGAGAGRSTPTFAIRGQSQQELTILADPSISIYIGDVVAPRSQGANGGLFDLASVQVLKGPQGTLFGRNSTGGVIQFIPNLPTDQFGGSASVTVGNLGTLNTTAVVNMPLGDTVSARLAFATNQDDGFVFDTLRGVYNNYTDNQALRFSLRWNITDTLQNVIVADVFHSNEGGSGAIIGAVNPNGSFNSAPARAARNYPLLQDMLAAQNARGIYETASGVDIFSRVDTLTIQNTTTWNYSDNITIRNIFGYREVDSLNYEDTDGLPIPLLEIQRDFNQHQYSNEFQVLGDHGNLNWIAGAYYFTEEALDQGISITGAVDPGVLQPNSPYAYPSWSNTAMSGENTSYAIFAQGTYAVPQVEGLSVTVGLRQNWDERNAVILNRTNSACRFSLDTDNNPLTPEVVPSLANCRAPLSTEYDELTYNLSADYRIADGHLVYIAHRHGYRTGGFGARASTQAGLQRTFRPEIVDDIEIGLKSDWWLGGAFLRTNVAVYFSDYQDIQRLLQDNTTIPVTTVTANAQKATVRGGEFEFLFRPNELFEFSGFWSHTQAEFETFIDPNGVDLSNSPFARSPENIYSLTGRFFAPISEEIGSELSFGATYFHTDGYYNNDSGAPTQFNPEYSLINLNADWRHIYGSDASVGVYINNAADEEYSLGLLDIYSSLGFSSRVPGEPRTYGVRLTYEF